ncbi:MAG: hypothetical protein OXG62_01195 [Nitrospinae bacterium]|nr:hypothetical protein [Nitrospinota bacterium]
MNRFHAFPSFLPGKSPAAPARRDGKDRPYPGARLQTADAPVSGRIDAAQGMPAKTSGFRRVPAGPGGRDRDAAPGALKAVVSPLLALMRDLVAVLGLASVAAEGIHSGNGRAGNAAAWKRRNAEYPPISCFTTPR